MSRKGRLAMLNATFDTLDGQMSALLAIENPTPAEAAHIEALDHEMDRLIEAIVELEDADQGEDIGQWFIIPTRRYP